MMNVATFLRSPRPALLGALLCLGLFAPGGSAAVAQMRMPLAAAPSSESGLEPIDLISHPIVFDEGNPSKTEYGRLVYRGGLELTSKHPRFGGFSGLGLFDQGRKLISISDRGQWIVADLSFKNGQLVGVSHGFMGALTDPDGKLVSKGGRKWSDAEGFDLRTSKDGYEVVISFERRHRLWRYPMGLNGTLGRPTEYASLKSLVGLSNNGGIEGVSFLGETGRDLLAFSELDLDPEDRIRGWILGGASPVEVTLPRVLPYSVSDVARGPDGTLYTLERRFSFLGGFGFQIRRLTLPTAGTSGTVQSETLIEAGAPLSVDNMEGLAVIRTEDGTDRLFIISDDNFHALERTLLLAFDIKKGP